MADWHNEALTMRHGGYGVDDIAVKLGVTRSAVYACLRRLREAEPEPLKNTDPEKRLLEAYFFHPQLGALGLAKRAQMKPGMVRAILQRAGLPEAKGATA